MNGHEKVYGSQCGSIDYTYGYSAFSYGLLNLQGWIIEMLFFTKLKTCVLEKACFIPMTLWNAIKMKLNQIK